eukprot:TRINITY_DN26324_c0_g1_i3.p1 TRINITY_DN26324_c0_g1~~TRINITY_DN26324_c0_g1_i3.p1  ORF type:complete len:324 (-),score=59.88 TRINITY_DN26324_c0_g1_i3:370-1341(-)
MGRTRGDASRPPKCPSLRLIVSTTWLSSAAMAAMPLELSPDSDLYNQDVLVKYFSEAYYNNRFGGVLPKDVQAEMHDLIALAQYHPSLALAAAQVVYMYGWFSDHQHLQARQDAESDLEARQPEEEERRQLFSTLAEHQRINWENVVVAAEFFEQSIIYAGCDDPSITVDVFLEERSCDTRWAHALVLHEYVAKAFGLFMGDHKRAQYHQAKAQRLLQGIKETPRFSGPCCAHWTQPLHFNFNAVFFPGKPSAAVWSTHQDLKSVRPPILDFLEAKFPEIKAELTPVLQMPREAWLEKAPAAVDAEHIASPGGGWPLRHATCS